MHLLNRERWVEFCSCNEGGPRHHTCLHQHFASLQAARTQNRLQFLLRQAEIFQHFAPPEAVQKAKKWVKSASNT